MKLSKLIEIAQDELKTKGDVDVVASVSWNEECDECHAVHSHTKSGEAYRAHVRDGLYTGNGAIKSYFFVVAQQ